MAAKIARWIQYAKRLPGGGETVLLLAGLAIIVGLAWGFIELADEVLEGDTQALDARIVRAMRRADDPSVPIGPYWVQEIGRDATALGGAGWLTFFTAVVAGYLWLDRKYRMTGFLLAATIGGLLVSGAMKFFFSRPRPDVVPHLSHVATSSFPSGHSLLSAVVYLTLGALVSAVTPHRRLKIYVLLVAVLLSVTVGVSRVYLGVHYPTDVLAGWMVGLTWALLCLLVARRLQRKGEIESSGETAGN